MTDPDTTRFQPPKDAPSARTPSPIDSARLFADRNEILIQHNGQIYRLRATKNGKLVMNK